MKTRRFFILAVLCLLLVHHSGAAQVLQQRISLTVKNATLPQVLQKIQQKYGVRFSYLNNSLPRQQLFSAEIKDQPLSEVLDVLLTKTDIGYLEKNGQVIIRRGLPKKQPKASILRKLPPASGGETRTAVKTPAAPVPRPLGPRAAGEGTPAYKTAGKETPASKTTSEPQPARQPEPAAPAPVSVSAPAPGPVPAAAPADTSRGRSWTITLRKPDFNFKKPDLTLPKADLRKLFAFGPADDSTVLRPYHFGLIYPLSTNGVQADRYVNRFSFQVLAGTAAGLEGFELAGIGNVEKRYVKGMQIGGVYNIVAGGPEPDSSAGMPGYTLQGWQVAGVLNLSRGKSDGVQIAGVTNISQDINGAQIAGVVNKAGRVKGAQIGGVLNRARHVSGAQIGLINIADSLSGVPIGLINIVKKNGYRRLEAYHADDFFANLTYKIGVPHFYNMVALGVERGGAQRWGYGAGLGAEWTLAKALRLNTDLLSYYVVEESYESFPEGLFSDYQLNLLNKFRLLATLQLGRRLALFGGPVYNVFVSDYPDPAGRGVGSRLVTDTFYDHTSADGVNVKMWVGFNAGIRF